MAWELRSFSILFFAPFSGAESGGREVGERQRLPPPRAVYDYWLSSQVEIEF